MTAVDTMPELAASGGALPPGLVGAAAMDGARRVLAVDIGTHGAAALLDEAGDLLAVEDLPILDSGPACRPEISAHLFAGIVRRWAPSRAWVEWIGPRQGDRPAGAFSFGASKATVETALAVLGVPFRTITPAVWKRAAGIPAGQGMKDLARSLAIPRDRPLADPRRDLRPGEGSRPSRGRADRVGWAPARESRTMIPSGPRLWWRRFWLILPLIAFTIFDVVVIVHYFGRFPW